MEYRGLVVVMTGASTGIGRATTLQLVRRGATVVGIARNADDLARLAADAGGLPGTCEPRSADVTQAEAITRTLGEIERVHGRIDVLVNNAGTGAYRPIVRTSVAAFDAIIRTN